MCIKYIHIFIHPFECSVFFYIFFSSSFHFVNTTTNTTYFHSYPISWYLYHHARIRAHTHTHTHSVCFVFFVLPLLMYYIKFVPSLFLSLKFLKALSWPYSSFDFFHTIAMYKYQHQYNIYTYIYIYSMFLYKISNGMYLFSLFFISLSFFHGSHFYFCFIL